MMLSFCYDREGILHHIGLIFLERLTRLFENILWKVCVLSAFLWYWSFSLMMQLAWLSLHCYWNNLVSKAENAEIFCRYAWELQQVPTLEVLQQCLATPKMLLLLHLNICLLYLFFSCTVFYYQSPCKKHVWTPWLSMGMVHLHEPNAI